MKIRSIFGVFGQGLYAGLSQQFAVDNAGNVTTSGTISTTAASTTVNSVRDFRNDSRRVPKW